MRGVELIRARGGAVIESWICLVFFCEASAAIASVCGLWCEPPHHHASLVTVASACERARNRASGQSGLMDWSDRKVESFPGRTAELSSVPSFVNYTTDYKYACPPPMRDFECRRSPQSSITECAEPDHKAKMLDSHPSLSLGTHLPFWYLYCAC